MALTQFADENDLSDTWIINLESGKVEFEAFGMIKPVLIPRGHRSSFEEVMKEFGSRGGKSVINQHIDKQKEKGYEPIKSIEDLKSYCKKYNIKHPIRDFFTGKSNYYKTRRSSITTTYTGVPINTTHYINKVIQFEGLIVCDLYTQDELSDEDNSPIGISAYFWNEDNQTIKSITVGKASFFAKNH